MYRLIKPIKTRIKGRKEIKKELDQEIANNPNKRRELPRMQKEKDREHDIKFLNNATE